MDRATSHKSLKKINHKDVISAIVLVTLQEMLAVQQENKECEKCGTRGHFAVCCWKRGAMKPQPIGNQGSYQARNRKAYHVAERVTGPGDGYAFVVGGQQETGEIT